MHASPLLQPFLTSNLISFLQAFVPTSISAIELLAQQGPFILAEVSKRDSVTEADHTAPHTPTAIPAKAALTPSVLAITRKPSIIAEASSDDEDEEVDYFKDDDRPVILFDGVCNL